MPIRTVRLAALMALLLPTAALAGGFNPCSGIRFLYAERIEPQGVLGSDTPDPDPGVVWRAVDNNSEISGEVRQEWAHDRDERYRRWREHGADTTSFEYYSLRAGDFYLGDTGYDRRDEDFMMYEFCLIARKRGLKQVVFACTADSHAAEDTPEREETYAYGTGSPAHGHVVHHPAVHRKAGLDAECFLSSYRGRESEPDWEDLEKYRLRDGEKSLAVSHATRFVRADEDRHELLKRGSVRTQLYMDALQKLVNGFVENDRSRWGWDYADTDGSYVALPDGTCVVSGSPDPLSPKWLEDNWRIVRRVSN